MGTGTGDMIRRCRESGLQEPEFSVLDGFVTLIRRKELEKMGIGLEPESEPESQPESEPESLEMRVLAVLKNGPLSKAQISDRLGQGEISGYLNKLIRLLLSDQTIEYTIPEKPNSRLQKYRLTAKGAALLAPKGKGKP